MSSDLKNPNQNGKQELPSNTSNEKGLVKKSSEIGKVDSNKKTSSISEEKIPVDYSVVDYKMDDDSKSETKPFNASEIKAETDTKESRKKGKKKMSLTKKIILCVCMAILGLLIGVGIFAAVYINNMLNKVTYIAPSEVTYVNEEGSVVDIEVIRQELAPQIPVIEAEHITNFLLIGIDSRSRTLSETGGLADVIMIMSINDTEGTIKLVSIARDSYAYVPGYKNPMKINAAMSRGGPELLQLTIENTLRLQIDGYAFVNFYNMAGVIDAVGGVYCDVNSTELYCEAGLNDNLGEINKLYGYAADYQQVNQTGTIWLNGRQAVAYARIRHADSDYKRSERQVEVLRSLLSQFMQLSATGKVSCMDDILALVATNIDKKDIISYGIDFLPSLENLQIQYFQLPLEGFFYSGMYGDEWSIRNNWNATIPYVQLFLYGETKDFDPVADIPNSPSLEKCPTEFDVEGHIS